MQYLLTSVNGVLSIGKRNAKICINMCFTLHFKWIVSVRYIYPKLLTIATWMLPNLNMYVCACAGVCVCVYKIWNMHIHTYLLSFYCIYLWLFVRHQSMHFYGAFFYGLFRYHNPLDHVMVMEPLGYL